MKLAHCMIRVSDLEESKNFFVKGFGFEIIKENEYPEWECTLCYLRDDEGGSEIELTYNWDSNEDYGNARNFGHIAILVDDIYETCEKLQEMGVLINRPPRDGHMAFVKTPDNISIEILQKGEKLDKKEPWVSMENVGSW
ncbi:MAG: VOC family protein [Fusobacteriota bacterium]